MTDDPVPDTVSEAVEFLRGLGYLEDVQMHEAGVTVAEGLEPTASAVVDYQFRFEGDSDPADEAIVLGISCPGLGRSGILVAGYGASMAPEHVAVVHALIGR